MPTLDLFFHFFYVIKYFFSSLFNTILILNFVFTVIIGYFSQETLQIGLKIVRGKSINLFVMLFYPALVKRSVHLAVLLCRPTD